VILKRICLLALAMAGTAFAADPALTEERIQRLQNGLMPPVLVRGEFPKLETLEARMAELHVPGVSIAVIEDGKIAWARGFGVTRAGGPPVTSDSLFQAASISKPVFALAVLRLADAGKLNIDANINDTLTSWKLPENDLTRQSPVTLRRLLSHSAGTTVHGFPGYGAIAPLPTTIQVLDGVAPANTAPVRVDLLPGARHRYSGGGYTVAQSALADLTGEPLPQFMRELVLEPLGMTRSTYEQPLPAARLAEVALPHDDKGTPLEGGPQVHLEMAAAGLWTTPSDLARYAIGVQRAFVGEAGSVIRARTAREMLVPVISNHGIGPVIGGLPTRKFFGHGGSNLGYRCVLVAYTEGRGVAIMTNGDNGEALYNEVLRTVAYIYQWPDFAPVERTLASLEPALVDRYVGAYLLNDGSYLVIRKGADRLLAQVPGALVNEIFASSESEFFGRDSDMGVSFSLAANGTVSGTKFRRGGFERAGPRVDEARSRQLVEAAENTARRIAEQKPQLASEAAARKFMAGIASGAPDYTSMGEGLAEIVRKQLPSLQKDQLELGQLERLSFASVGPRGEDVFHADFAKGKLRVELRLDEKGLLDSATLAPR
jgi:CubicO group peptidase (beta-lactamase class C family)